MDEIIKSILPQMPMVAIMLAIFWLIRADALKIYERLESRIDRLIDALIDDDETP